jgi:hypothetical protein
MAKASGEGSVLVQTQDPSTERLGGGNSGGGYRWWGWSGGWERAISYHQGLDFKIL